MTRPRILVLTPRYPYPVVGGDRLRIHHICRNLAPHCDLTLISMCDSQAEMNQSLPDDRIFTRIERVLQLPRRSYLNVLRSLPTRLPMQVAYYFSQEFRARYQELIAQHDLCLGHLLRTAEYMTESGKPRVLEMTDAISRTYERAIGLGRNWRLRSFVYRLEESRVREYEMRVLGQMDLVTVVSERDRAYLQQRGSWPNLIVCGNGIDLTRFPFSPKVENRTIVFVGAMTTLPNIDACTWFAKNVLPELHRDLGVKLKVVGRIRERDAMLLRRLRGVQVTGEVPDVVAEMRGALAAICPMRIGSGIQNKILEYMAVGIPTITSSLSLEGLAAQPRTEVLVADTAADYRAHVEMLLREPDRGGRIAAAGRAYVEREHDWGRCLAPLVRQILQLCGRAPLDADSAAQRRMPCEP
jgi:glycosyltransferase involved in cell wall biosynthesis